MPRVLACPRAVFVLFFFLSWDLTTKGRLEDLATTVTQRITKFCSNFPLPFSPFLLVTWCLFSTIIHNDGEMQMLFWIRRALRDQNNWAEHLLNSILQFLQNTPWGFLWRRLVRNIWTAQKEVKSRKLSLFFWLSLLKTNKCCSGSRLLDYYNYCLSTAAIQLHFKVKWWYSQWWRRPFSHYSLPFDCF